MGHAPRHGLDEFAPQLSFSSTRTATFRRDCQVPRGPAHLAQSDDGALRLKDRAIVCLALSHADRGLFALTAQQPYNNVVRTALQAWLPYSGYAIPAHKFFG